MASRKTSDCIIRHTYHEQCEEGFVYIAQNQGIYKIGCAKRWSTARNVYKTWGDFANVYSRLCSLKRQTGKKFSVVDILYTPGCVRSLEKSIHDVLFQKRVSKHERFQLDSSDIEWLRGIESFKDTHIYHCDVDVWAMGK